MFGEAFGDHMASRHALGRGITVARTGRSTGAREPARRLLTTDATTLHLSSPADRARSADQTGASQVSQPLTTNDTFLSVLQKEPAA